MSENRMVSLKSLEKSEEGSFHAERGSLDEKPYTSESLSLIRELHEDSSDGILLTDGDGRILWANRAFENLLGASCAVPVGEKCDLFLREALGAVPEHDSPETEPAPSLPDSEVIRISRGENTPERRLLHRSQSLRQSPLCGLRIERFIDITDRHKAALSESLPPQAPSADCRELAETLRVREEKYRLLVENQSDLIVKLTPSGRFSFVSPSFCRLFRQTEEELVGNVFLGMIHGDDRRETLQALKKLRHPPYRTQVEHRARTLEGWRWLSWAVNSVLNEKKGLSTIVAVGRDITGQKRMEEALRESELRFRTIFRSASAGILVVNPRGRILQANPAFCSFIGSTEEELRRMSVQDITHPEDRAGTCRRLEESRTGIPTFTDVEKRYLRRDGETVWGRSTGTWVTDRQGKLLYRVALIQDVTERRRAEKELKYREAFEKLIADISRRFISLPPERSDEGINYALEAICRFTHTDNSYLFQYDADTTDIVTRTHYYRGENLDPASRPVTSVRRGDFPWVGKKIQRFENVRVSRLKDLPAEAEAEKAFWKNLGVRSILIVPVVSGGSLCGLMGFESRLEEKSWEGREPELLNVVGEILGNALERRRAEEALRQSEERFRCIFEAISFGVAVLDLRGRFIQANHAMSSLLGYSEKEFLQLSMPRITAPEDRAMFRKILRETRSGKRKSFEMEKRYLHKDGRIIWGRVAGASVLDERGKFLYSVAILQDITEQKKAEESLRESEMRFRTLLDQAADSFLVYDLEGRITEVNERAVESLGYSRRELLERNIADIEIGWSLEELPEHWRRIEPGVIITVRGKHRCKDGRILPVETRLRRIETEGRPLIFALARDITERLSNEERLNRSLAETEASRDKINGILRSIASGLLVTDEQNRIVLMNPGAEELLGVSFSQVSLHPMDSIVQDRALKEKILRGVSSQDGVYRFDFELSAGDDSDIRIIQARTSEIRDQRGRGIGFVTDMHDVTREREIDQLKSEFISTAAHELRTPLTSIQGFAEVLQIREDLSPEARNELLSIIIEQSDALAEIISDLLDIAHIESGRGVVLKKEPCDLASLVRQTVDRFSMQSDRHRFQIEIPDGASRVKADKGKIRQVLENILSNAIKYSPEGGTIRIRGKVEDNAVMISFRDQGIGMTPEQMEHMFDKFYRADTSNSAVSGVGLGLSIVKYIIEAHSGEIRVDSRPGRGTTISFCLPIGPGVEN